MSCGLLSESRCWIGGEYFDEVFNFLSSSMDPENLSKPQAYLVYLFYDLNMDLVENSSGVLQVQDPNDLGLLKEEQIVAKEAGYFYTYSCPERRRRPSASEVEWVMNSSGSEVNFDEYKITYIRPKVRAINHYYPYGLQMYGLDQLDKDYTYKYTGKELQSGDILDNSSTGLELYDIEARYYDPATGLWHVPDPAEQFHNPYLAMGNNPVNGRDPNGEWFIFYSWIIGFIDGFFSKGSNRFENGWSEANQRAGTDAEIIGGLFATDPNKDIIGRAWELVSRFTYQLPQTIGGYGTAPVNNTFRESELG